MFLASKSPQRKALLESLGVDFEITLPHYHEVDPSGTGPAELVERHSLGKALSVLPSLIPLSVNRPVLGVDTMVVVDGEAIGKAADENEARSCLERLSGRTHEVVSGVTLIGVAAATGTAPGISGVICQQAAWDADAGAVPGRAGQSDSNMPAGGGAGCSGPRSEFTCSLLTTEAAVSQKGLWRCTGHSVTTVKFSEISDAETEAYLATCEWRGRAGAYAIQERASAFVEEIHGDYTNVVGLPVPLLVAMLKEAGLWPPVGWDN